MVLKEGIVLMMAGMAIGITGALLLTRLLRSLLFEVAPTDPFTLFCVTLGLAAVALAAALIPARRAFRVDPMVTLRYG
jgi:putative ABC transport system permease protein